jgi:hypothetical integral membrane protein (TIGR02206 family)
MERVFTAFDSSHRIVLALTLLAPVTLAFLSRRHPNKKLARLISVTFAVVLITTWTVWYWLITRRGWISAQTFLPMNLCDWATIATVATLLRPNQRTYELAYFWALSGTFQALATPELFYDFPDIRFIIFFLFHGGTIAAVLFLTFACGMRPYAFSLPRVTAWSLLYLACALTTNRLFGTNFGYLSAKPATPSLLDIMGPWPIYVFELMGLGILYVLLLYAPFFVADRMRAHHAL